MRRLVVRPFFPSSQGQVINIRSSVHQRELFLANIGISLNLSGEFMIRQTDLISSICLLVDRFTSEMWLMTKGPDLSHGVSILVRGLPAHSK